MKRNRLLALSVMALAACAPPAAHQSAEIAALSDGWEEAFGNGDVDTLVAMYTDGARVLAPNAEAAAGRDAVRAAFGAMIDQGLEVELETVEAVVAGDLGHHVGTYSITADGALVDRGKFLETWRQVGGEWKIDNDIWNSDLPTGPVGSWLIGTHEVEDPDRWLAAWQGPDSRREDFRQHGVHDVRVFQSSENPKLTGLLVDVADMDALMAWLQSEEGERAKAEDGVIDETLRILTAVE